MSRPKGTDKRIAGIILLGTPLNERYKTSDLKTKELGKLLRKICTAMLKRNNP